MGLKLKSMYEVFTSLVDWITLKSDRLSDFNVGSALRTLTEAIAIQFEEFYFAMQQNINYAIENAVYESFGFNIKPSSAASGEVTIDFEEPLPSDLTFAAGTVFCTSATYGYIYYESTETVYAKKGDISVLVPVQCKTTGELGNIPSGAITTIVTTNSVIKSVYNLYAFVNGTEEETNTERKKRFQDYIKTLARGTADSIVYGCLEVDGVTGAWADDNYIGYVKLYAHDANGNLSEELRQKILKNLDNYRAGGIEVEVLPIVKKSVDLSISVILNNDYDTSTYAILITSLVESHLNSYSVASPLYISDLIHIIKSAYDSAVINILLDDLNDVMVNNNELIRPGTITTKCTNLKDWVN